MNGSLLVGEAPSPKLPHYLMQFFSFSHLPAHLQRFSSPFHVLAAWIDEALPDNPEKDTAMRKLLEAKDCGARAQLFKT